jgi:transposase InsO family protein
LPASTIHRILLRRGLVRLQDRHAAAVQRFERAQPNQLWQMDFKGSREWQTHVGPLSVLDDYSRYLIALRGTWTTKAEAVREQLESAFSECGVPEAMLMDHGTPWWNARAPTGATWLTLWLMRQGIELHWSGYRHPQTQGKVERFHGSLQRAQGRRGVPDKERQQWLDAYRDEYNQVRPHEALGMRTPASVWRKSERRYDPHPAPWQYATGATVVKVGSQGQIWANQRRWEISYALAGQCVELVQLEERVLVYHCRTLIRELDLVSQCSTAVEHWLTD